MGRGTRLPIAVAAVAAAAWSASGGETIRHFVPADKKLAAEWVQGLYERGGPAAWSGKELETIGMPCGGIAAGQLYLRGDGSLALWQVFNKHVFTGYGKNCYRTYRPASPVDSGFAVHVVGGPTLRLSRDDFADVQFVGEYPIATVRYAKGGFPLQVEMEVFSPFIPLHAKDSALPATLFHVTLTNASHKPVKAGLGGWLENAVLLHSAKAVHAQRRSRIVRDRGRTLLVHTVEKAPRPKTPERPRPKIVVADFEGADYGDWKVTGKAFGRGPAHGTLPSQQKVSGFQGKGLVNTYLGGNDKLHGTLTSPPFAISRRFINLLVGGGNHAGKTCINLLVDGKAVRTAHGTNHERLQWHFWNVESLAGKQAQLQIVDRESGGWGHVNIDQIELADVPAKAPAAPLDQLPDYGSLVLAIAGQAAPGEHTRALVAAMGDAGKSLSTEADAAFPASQRRSTLLATPPVELAPGAKHTITAVLAWCFPNHPRGREYANRFKSAADVAHYVLDHHERLAGQTRLWHKTFYDDSTLPRWLLFRLHSTVSNLATGTCQWWGNGRFWAWEGVGCCAGTCTHVWNYAHAAARLFPELERSAREMQDFGAGFDARTGLVGFRSNRAYAADGQCGTILKAYREHTMSPDDAFLRRNWPKIKKALQFSIGRDRNADGFIEDSQHNTYDINFQGPNTFVGSLYLAALRAGEQMATEMGDEPFARQCRAIFDSGRRLTLERLWDGEYFVQRVDLKRHPKHQYGRGCLSDQLFGQGWAHQLGLGRIYPPDKVRSALQAVWKYNWAPDVAAQNAVHRPLRVFARPGEAGLFTCTWPKSAHLSQGVLYKNEIWTGIEYQVAGHMAWEGMVTQALAICRGIHDRYHPARHNPYNEVECGDHYARALASWGVYTGLCGYEHHGPKGHLAFAPRLTPDSFAAAFTAAEGWGLYSQKRHGATQTHRIEVRWGKLRLNTLALAVPDTIKAPKAVVTAGGRPVTVSHATEDGRLNLKLAEQLVVAQGQALEVTIR